MEDAGPSAAVEWHAPVWPAQLTGCYAVQPGKEHRHDPANPRPHTSGNTGASARTGAPAEVDIEIERRSAAEAV